MLAYYLKWTYFVNIYYPIVYLPNPSKRVLDFFTIKLKRHGSGRHLSAHN